MSSRPLSLVAALVSIICVPGLLPAQADKSHSAGFFAGLGVERDGIVTTQRSNHSQIHESGSGEGLVLGYGFSPRLSLYGGVSGANIDASGGGTYALTHVDLGARVHFRTGPHAVVPFLQFGIAGRDERQTLTSPERHTTEASGGGVSLGGGINAHVNPSWALSGSVTWTLGSFSTFRIDNTVFPLQSENATSTRVHLGLVWFPGA